MKIINNNIRAAKRTVYRPGSGCGGIGFIEEFTQNRTQEKSENDVCEREYDPTSESS